MSDLDKSAEFDAEEQQILKGVELLFSDRLNEAEDFFDELRINHPRYSLHHAEVAAFVALMSSDQDDVDRAIVLLSETEALASQQAQKYSTHSNMKKVNEAVSSIKSWALGKMAKKGIAVGAAKAAAEEAEEKAAGAHEELLHVHRIRRTRLWALQIQAECYLMTSLLQIVGAGESWTAMVKLGYNLKKTWSIYARCEKKLRKLNKEWVKMGGNFKHTEDMDDDSDDESDSDSDSEGRSSKGKSNSSSSSQMSKSRTLADKFSDLSFEEDSSTSSRPAHLDIKQLDALRDDQRLVLDTRKGIKEDIELSSLRIGLEFGIGAFNLISSLIPASFQKATEVMGIPGERNKSLRLLQKVAATNHPRSPFAYVMLLQYHTVIMGLLSYTDQHAKESKVLVDKLQPHWRNGSLFRITESRYHRYEGNLPQSREILVKYPMKVDQYDINNRGCNQRLRHLMTDELGWCYLLEGDFVKAAECFGKLFKDSVWFKPFYGCLQAACLWQSDPKFHAEASGILRDLPTLVSGKKQIGPLEQYGLRIANEFNATNQAPLFPAFELVAVYNGFAHMDNASLERHLHSIEAMEKSGGSSSSSSSPSATESSSGSKEYKHNWNHANKLLCKFLSGLCQRALGHKEKAKENFRFIIDKAENVSGNIVPYSCYELSSILLQDDVRSQEGMGLLEKCLTYPPHEFQHRLKFIVSEMTKIYKPLAK